MRTLRLRDVEAKVGLRRSTIYALSQEGKFPRPIKLSLHASAWVESEIDAWLNERIAAAGRAPAQWSAQAA
jgi:prophage regulatory protein